MNLSLTHPRPARKERAFQTLVSFAVAALVVLPGCGSDSRGAPPNSKGQQTEGQQGTGEQDAGDEDAGACNDLESAAATAFGTFVDQHATCATDTDCTLVTFTESSFCASPCGMVMNQAGAASAVGVASQDCAQFNAQGCSPPLIGCPGFGSPICAAGACALYTLELAESGAFVHGACTALTEIYEQSWVKGPAPRDFALTVTATGGTLYADGACTTPLSSSAIALPEGSTSTTFGFIPAAVGPFSVSIDDVGGSPGGISGDAQ
jgi:hypothetical protein